MAQNERHTVEGRISIVQEERFRLVTGDSRVLLLTLAERAPLEITDLQRFHEEGTRVEVEYEGEPNTNSGIAHRIRALDAAH